jgi:predicted alpha/beta superfamily hydrolase
MREFVSRMVGRVLMAAACVCACAGAGAAGSGSRETTTETLPHRFVYQGHPDAAGVAVTGDMFGWNPKGAPMAKGGDGAWEADVMLEPGRHLYKFVVNGTQWLPDPDNPEREPDSFGGENSVLVVGSDGDRRAARKASRMMSGFRSPWTPADDVAIGVEGVPGSFAEQWIPVRFAGGKLRFDASPQTTGGRLLLSARPLHLPGSADGRTTGGFASRPVFVWLPPGYMADTSRRYPVIYLHDGQNVWDDPTCAFGHGGWELNRAMERGAPRLAAAILVGVPNSAARLWEYGMGGDILELSDTPHLRFLRDVVKPRVDADFRTMPDAKHTGVMGSSMGGVISIIAAWRNPEVFGSAAALSPAFAAADESSRTLTDLLRKKGPGRFRLYLDSGSGGEHQDGAPRTREFARLARNAGWARGSAFAHFEDPGALHNEGAWRARAWRPLLFLLAGKSGAARAANPAARKP